MVLPLKNPGETENHPADDILKEKLNRAIEQPTDAAKRSEYQRKIEIMGLLAENISSKVQNSMEEEMATQKSLSKGVLTFKSDGDRLEYWKAHLAGHLFEDATEFEYHLAQNPLEAGQKLSPKQLRQIEISHILMDIAKHPDKYGLHQHIGFRLPDAIATKIVKVEDKFELEVDGIVEAKLSETLDERATKQLSKQGSRATITNLIGVLNETLPNLGRGQQKLARLKELLGDMSIKPATELSLEVVFPGNRVIPDSKVLSAKKEKGDESEIKYGLEEGKLRRLLGLDEKSDINIYGIADDVKAGNITFNRSIFTSVETWDMVQQIIDTPELNLQFPGEISKPVSQKSEETLDTAESRVRNVVQNVKDAQKYLVWLHSYLNSGGANPDFHKEEKDQISKVTFEDNQNLITARHEVSGLSVTVYPEKFKPRDALKTLVTAHFDDWREFLAQHDPEGIASLSRGAKLTPKQQKLADELVAIIQQNAA